MRAVSRAIWTSGEPVSLSLSLCDAMMLFFDSMCGVVPFGKRPGSAGGRSPTSCDGSIRRRYDPEGLRKAIGATPYTPPS